MKNLAILASHNGSGFDAIYKAVELKKLHCNISLVISNNTNAKVLQKAKDASLQNYLVNAKLYANPDEKIYELLVQNNVEYIFLSGYMKKLPAKITQNFKVINSHPSLLPKYGGEGMYGRFVHEAIIKNKEKGSGVTIHYVNEVYDSGEIILQKEMQLSENETVDSLEKSIKQLEASAIVEGIQKCLN